MNGTDSAAVASGRSFVAISTRPSGAGSIEMPAARRARVESALESLQAWPDHPVLVQFVGQLEVATQHQDQVLHAEALARGRALGAEHAVHRFANAFAADGLGDDPRGREPAGRLAPLASPLFSKQ